ncbi:hypothetical protein [Micromonospora sp. KC723]|uniref:hypothetical protein n=1 Tax=Micromonospora sp. KC723 TaxID=2530381 RepID=UPI001047BE19|nr:hypothetical protein [Micromonospora sp. KC723]TDB76925.1 hypothetical protein E1165_05090 [Micromonospora sp. KC723]
MSRTWGRLGLLTAALLVAPGATMVSAADRPAGHRPTGSSLVGGAGAGSAHGHLLPAGTRPFAGIRRSQANLNARHAVADPPAPADLETEPSPQAWAVSLAAVDRAGRPAVDGRSGYAVYDLQTARQVAFGQLGPDTVVELPAGRYAVRATILTPGPTGDAESSTMALRPEITVAGPVDVVLDARPARRVTVRLTDADATSVSASVTVLQQASNGRFVRHEFGGVNFDDTPFYVTPTPQRADTTSYVYTVWQSAAKLYNLVQRTAGRVPDRLDLRVRPADLAAVRTRYTAQATGACGGTYIGPIFRNGPATVSFGTNFALPARRTEYYLPDPEVGWYTQFAQAADCGFAELDGQTGAPRTYHRAGVSEEVWNAAPLTPAVSGPSGEPLATRDGDQVTAWLPLYSDTQRRRVDFGGPYVGVTGSLALTAADMTPCVSATFEPLSCLVPPGTRDFRLTATARRDVRWSALSTRTETTWTFRSGTGTGRLPLIGTRYDLRLDDFNRAPAGRPFGFTVATDPPVPTARLSASTDGGVTWRAVPLTPTGDGWRALVANPAKGGVSLRFTATDSSGSTVTQQVDDAYLVG